MADSRATRVDGERAWLAHPSRALPRRSFLRVLGLGGVGIAAAGALGGTRSLLETVSAATDLDGRPAVEGSLAQRQWAFVIDLRRCDGCRECTKGCQRMHYLPEEQEWIKVYELTDETGANYFLPVLCQMCEIAPCVQVCPVTATYHEPGGAVLVDQSVCIGCRMCMAACPYGVRTFNWRAPGDVPASAQSEGPLFQVPQRQGTVGKCDSCAHALRDGQMPACLESCAMYAIYVGDLVEDVATNGRETVALSWLLRENDAFRFKEGLGTEPRVYYIAGHGQALEY